MLTVTRRRAIATSLAACLAHSVLAKELGASTQDVDARTLASFLDVLLPADEHSPSASQLGVDSELLDLAAPVELFVRLLALGTLWLNDTGRGPFHSVSSSDRHKVVSWMSASDINQIPGRFYQLVRLTAVEIYYSRPEAIGGFDLNPAPQPAGYPPPWL